MSGQQLQSYSQADTAVGPVDPAAEWADEGPPKPAAEGPSLARYVNAVRRFKWMILALTVLGGVAGVTATRFVEPEYEVKATILLEQGTGTGTSQGNGPIQAAELLEESGWKDLLRSYSIADEVVRSLGLYVTPSSAEDSVALRAFNVDPQRLRPGKYSLTTEGGRYTLTGLGGLSVERGALGDSIGRTVGFLWQPAPDLLRGRSNLDFTVRTPREVAVQLINTLGISLMEGSSFLFLTLNGKDSRRTAATLNAWASQFVTVATMLKKKNVALYASILEGQRQYAAENLAAAEQALEGFRVRTVTEPSERETITPGLDMTNSPVFQNYFRDKIAAADLSRDRGALERLLIASRNGVPVAPEAVLSVPLAATDPAAEQLRIALKELSDREIKLRALRQNYTDEYSGVKNELAALRVVRQTTVPTALESFVEQLKLREQQLSQNITASEKDLRQIPSRTIEEARLKRAVQVSEDLYRQLDVKSNEAKLADAATIPDVSVLDSAVAPLSPVRNTAPILILGGIGAALALAIFLAIVLDQVDKRFRYPEQVTKDLGLFVLGVLPVIGRKRRSQADVAAQMVEAFRTIRMNVRYAVDPTRPMSITVTSPGPNDGKSFVSANLALSFAEAGARTLLIDGDIRRGALHEVFGAPKRPGLVEYLDGTALIAEVLHPVSQHPNLTLMPGGARRRRGPELLATPRLQQLIAQMGQEYDVVIVDSPPLGAGFDAYALSTATVNMCLVMRAGVTDRKMAAARMAVVDTLPVRVLGAVLNGIEMTGIFQYYSYYQSYAAEDERPVGQLEADDEVPALSAARTER